ncbi:LysE family translocator [Acidipropionibacterium virtanenii]|uniref:Cysteine/O-acetylserine efflux protein n=1 Tax=Acidipropionibacterium virtanenii TaxID=2057246 RepID=A0A344UUN0_9ACTN|nr:LysE family transporter [Acidipropionibacterium virtanenii]AXE38978.1 Cysteine/O-acetylserine efflux protein [Acidipropionibacterium virtanenii]
MNWWAFLIYTAVMAFTPGPNNLVAFDVARRTGMRSARRLLQGLAAGFLVIDAVVVVAASVLDNRLDQIEPWLKMLGTAYLLYLAWATVHPGAHHSADASGMNGLFARGLLVNLTNVKVLLFFLVGLTGYLVPETGSITGAAAVSLVMPLTCCVSNLVWAQAGSLLCSWLARHRRDADLVIAILLAGCAVTLWL